MRKGYFTNILGNSIYRLTLDNTGVYHYTTRVYDPANNGVAGFSMTDASYLRKYAKKTVYCYQPRNRAINSVILDLDNNVIPDMSADVLAYHYDDAVKRRLLKDSSPVVYDYLTKQYISLDSYKPSYIPSIRDAVEYTAEYPMATFIIHEPSRKHTIDIFNKYSVYAIVRNHPFHGKLRYPCFISYTNDLIELGVIPVIQLHRATVDAYRSFTMVTNEQSNWIRLTNHEWAGSGSESASRLAQLEQFLIHYLHRDQGYDAVGTLLSYSSNIFVLYVDFFIHIVDTKALKFIRSLQLELKDIELIECEDIARTLFNIYK